ncbi:MAG: hypothetical protein HYZ01_06250 [Ignavibacteriales bacterium]|nr:hypothetical protein [Ignavibacteriales bacterium]
MNNKTGSISGFIFGVASFLLMFKLIVLDNIPPSDELAPGIVVLASFFNGLLFAFVGHWIQHHFRKKVTTTESE